MKSQSKVRTLVGIGIFSAIVLVLQFFFSTLARIGVFSLTLVLVPIVVGTAIYGWKAGGILGFTFGVAVLLSPDSEPFFAVDPFATILVVLAKGTLCGIAAGLTYKLLERVNRYLAVIAAALVCPVVNTGIFLLGCQLFFLETVTGWGQEAGFENVGAYLIFGMVGTNFLIELAANMVLSPVIRRLIRIGKN